MSKPQYFHRQFAPFSAILASLILGFAATLLAHAGPHQAQNAPAKMAGTANAQDAGKELERIRSEIRQATEAVQTEAAHKDQAAKAMRNADQALKHATHQYEQTKQARAQSEKRREQLAEQAEEARRQLADHQARLSEFARTAQAAERGDSMAMVLNGQNPAEQSRLLDYFGYIGNVRAAEIKNIEAQAHQLQQLEEDLSGEVKRLANLEEETRARTTALDAARAERKRSLDQLTQSVANRAQQLKDLKSNAAALEKLIERLNRVVHSQPIPQKPTTPGVVRGLFGQLRGQLQWPVVGKIVARFGEERIGGMHWSGLLFETKSAGEVKAAAAGRVIYSDWLPGLGQLIILDHGSGYISLYGYNDSLKRAVGEQVSAGEVIATTAQTESGNSKMYFEIRDSGRPVDPAIWLAHAH